MSSNLHDFTEEQLESIHAIVNLYRGDNSLFNLLIDKYTKEGKAEELEWLSSRFPDGEYINDIKGLCKVVTKVK